MLTMQRLLLLEHDVSELANLNKTHSHITRSIQDFEGIQLRYEA